MSTPAERANDVLAVSLARADAVVTATDAHGARAARELLRDLRAADRLLRERLGRLASDDTFTAASMVAYQRQVRLVTARVRTSLSMHVGSSARAAARGSVEHAAALLTELETAFRGIARPLRISTAATMSSVVRRADSSLLIQRRRSVERYGTSMIREFERRMRVGLLSGLSQREMVASLVEHGGPEGLFTRYRSWAWRIVRTETARAYNVTRTEALFEQRRELPQLRKKILATFDARTAMDSVLVHGQVRALEECFVDGAGRVYLQPPARPYDREVVIPWMPEWSETPISRPATAEMVEAARRNAGVDIPRAHRLASARAVSAANRAA